MGASVIVGSLIPSVAFREQYPEFSAESTGKEYIHLICQSLGWDSVPWDEATYGDEAFSTNIGYGSLESLLEFAKGELPELRLSDAPLNNLSQEERFRQYRQFLESDKYIGYYNPAFYLPVDFPEPRHLKTANTTFLVASSLRLAKEMEALEQEVFYYIQKYGEYTISKLA